MSKLVECCIRSKPFPVERLWAHLNPKSSKEREPFSIRVPLLQAESTFDPSGERMENEGLGDYLSRLFNEHGSFMVQGMLSGCRNLNGVQKQPFEFIIVSVDSVVSDDSSVTISGSVIAAADK